MDDLEHPEITNALRIGYPHGEPSSGLPRCCDCGEQVEPWNDDLNYLVRHDGQLWCGPCYINQLFNGSVPTAREIATMRGEEVLDCKDMDY